MRRRGGEIVGAGVHLAAAAALLLALSGCVFTHGAQEERREAIRRPTGEDLWVRLNMADAGSGDDSRYVYTSGELLEVREEGLLLATDSGFLHIPFAYVEIPDIEDPEALRYRARYPYGLDDVHLTRLMDELELERVDTVGVEPAPPPDSAGPAVLQDFLTRARKAAAPYHSLEQAVAAGYRLLGPSFPGMGEHWIHPGLIVEDRVVPERPPVLCYVMIDGERRLVGLAFAVPLEPDELPPVYPAGRTAWHDHTDHVDEEVLLLNHPGSHHGAEGPRLAMFHTWLWEENPDGVLAQNNWRLPFVEAGLSLDSEGLRPSADAARGLSLHTAGPDYYLELFEAAAALEADELTALGDVLEDHARQAARFATTASAEVDGPDLARLEALWSDLWTEIAAVVQPETFHVLAMLR